jgi:hypothetical protein
MASGNRDHNKGQEDSHYEPPYTKTEEFIDFLNPWGGGAMSEGHARNSQYDKGWSNRK